MSTRHSLPRVSRTPKPLGKILGLLGVFLLTVLTFGSWAFSSAVGSAADDDYHLSSIWCASFAGNTCEVDPEGEGVFIPESLREGIYCYYHNQFQSAGCQPFMDGTDPRPDVPFAHNNPSRNLYPNGYYNFHNLFKVDSIEATALTVRFVNLGIFLGAGFLLFYALPRRLRSTWVWVWIIGLVPMGMFVIPSSNPSSWAITAVAAGWIALLGYLETRGLRAWILGLVFIASAILAVSARVDAVLYLGFASLVAIWLSATRGKELVKKIWPGLIPLTVVVVALIINPANLERVVGGLGSRDEYTSDPLPWSSPAQMLGGSAFDWGLLWHNFWNIPGLWLGIFGGSPWGALGWLDTIMPQIVLAGTMAVLVTIVIISLRSADKKQLTAFFAVLAALWAMPLYLLQLGGFVTGEQIQPRYMLPLMIVLLGTLLVRQDGKPLLTKPGELWFVIIALTLANAIALHTNIRRYTTGMGVQGFNLDSPREWWWLFFPDFLGPTLLWAIGSVSFGVLLWALLFRVVPGTFDLSGLAPRESNPELAPAAKA
jgi:hypothetical protein